MIVFINGPFGVGKTTAALALQERCPGSIILDPEDIGTILQRALHDVDPVDDFQDYVSWRKLVGSTIVALDESYGGTLFVPMTLWRIAYFRQITDVVRESCEDVHAVCLTATIDVLKSRILGRRREDGSHEWALKHMQPSLAAFSSGQFGELIDTSNISVDIVATSIIAALRR